METTAKARHSPHVMLAYITALLSQLLRLAIKCELDELAPEEASKNN